MRFWTYSLLVLLPLGVGTAFADLSDDLETRESAPAPKEEPKSQTKPVPVTPQPVPAKKVEPKSKTPTTTEKTDEAATEPKPETKKPATQTKKQDNRKNLPVHFSTEGTSILKNAEGILRLPEGVIITQGDLKLEANSADIYFLKKGQGQEDIDKAELKGNVRVTRFSKLEAERISAKGDRAIFANSERKVDLIGNARVFKEGKLITGKQISYDLDSGNITIVKAEGYVKPEDNNTAQKKTSP